MIIDPFRFGGSLDPYYSDTILIANFDGTDGETTFTNEAPVGTTPTPAGSAALSNAQSPFGTTSLRCTSTKYAVSSGSNSVYALGTGDFTIEAWFRADSVAGTNTIWDQRPYGTTGVYPLIVTSTTEIRWSINGTTRIASGTGVVSATTWYYAMVARASGTTRMFLGTSGGSATQVGSDYTDSNDYLSGSPCYRAGGNAYGSNLLVGYLGPVRVTKGVARETGTFSVPTDFFPGP